jgi:DNA-binding transcriptional regulator YiaG
MSENLQLTITTLGQRIRAVRDRAGLSQSAAANAWGFSAASIRKWESGYSPYKKNQERLEPCLRQIEESLPELGQRIAAALQRGRLSEAKAARILKVRRTKVYRWMIGRSRPIGETRQRLKAFLEQIENSPPAIVENSPAAIDWAARIRKAREKAGLSRNQAASRWGVSETNLYFWETHRRNVEPNQESRAQLEPILAAIEANETKPVSLDSPVKELKVNSRAEHLLDAAGIKTIGELAQLSKSALLKHRNCGPRTAQNIQEALASADFSLKEPPPPPRPQKKIAASLRPHKPVVYIPSKMLSPRGWTPKKIRELLGAPDTVLLNYQPPMELYLLSRVEAAERSSNVFWGAKQMRRHPRHTKHVQPTPIS